MTATQTAAPILTLFRWNGHRMIAIPAERGSVLICNETGTFFGGFYSVESFRAYMNRNPDERDGFERTRARLEMRTYPIEPENVNP